MIYPNKSESVTPAPERIHHWLNGSLSYARRSGGCTFKGCRYIVAYDEIGQPLVRVDVLRAERAVTVVAREVRGAANDARMNPAEPATQGGAL